MQLDVDRVPVNRPPKQNRAEAFQPSRRRTCCPDRYGLQDGSRIRRLCAWTQEAVEEHSAVRFNGCEEELTLGQITTE